MNEQRKVQDLLEDLRISYELYGDLCLIIAGALGDYQIWVPEGPYDEYTIYYGRNPNPTDSLATLSDLEEWLIDGGF